MPCNGTPWRNKFEGVDKRRRGNDDKYGATNTNSFFFDEIFNNGAIEREREREKESWICKEMRGGRKQRVADKRGNHSWPGLFDLQTWRRKRITFLSELSRKNSI